MKNNTPKIRFIEFDDDCAGRDCPDEFVRGA